MHKYIVISHDPDQQQTFVDYVLAKNAVGAEEQVADSRDYAQVALVETPAGLHRIAAKCVAWSPEQQLLAPFKLRTTS